MTTSNLARLGSLLVVLALPLAGYAHEIGLTWGTGPGHFESQAIDAEIELGKLPLRLFADYYDASSESSRMVQTDATLKWQVAKPIDVRLGIKRLDDKIFVMEGGDFGVKIRLEQLWSGRETTSVDLTYEKMDYTPSTRRSLPQALLDRLPEQRRYTIGLEQGLTRDVSVNLSYDRYDYSQDPVALAKEVALTAIRRGARPPGGAFVLTSFPEHGYSAGLQWQLTENFGLDLSYDQFETVLGQRQKSTSVSANRAIGAYIVGLTVSRSSDAELTTAGGFTLSPASSATYVSLRASMQF